MSTKAHEKPKHDAKRDTKSTTHKPGMIDTPKTGMTRDSSKKDNPLTSPSNPANDPNLPSVSHSNDPINQDLEGKAKNKAGQPVKDDGTPKASWEDR